jgi:hypothetical protein
MSPHSIISLVADASNVTVEQILSNRRPWYIVLPRWKAMWLCMHLIPNADHRGVGKWFKKKRGCVAYALEALESLPESLKKDLPELKARCLGELPPPIATAWAGARLLLESKSGKVQEFKVIEVIH